MSVEILPAALPALNHRELQQLNPMHQYGLVLRPQFARASPHLPLHCVAHGTDFRLFQVKPEGSATRLLLAPVDR